MMAPNGSLQLSHKRAAVSRTDRRAIAAVAVAHAADDADDGHPGKVTLAKSFDWVGA